MQFRRTCLWVWNADNRQIAPAGLKMCFHRRELRRLIPGDHLSVAMARNQGPEARNRREDQPSGERTPRELFMLAFQQIPRRDAHDEKRAEHESAHQRMGKPLECGWI